MADEDKSKKKNTEEKIPSNSDSTDVSEKVVEIKKKPAKIRKMKPKAADSKKEQSEEKEVLKKRVPKKKAESKEEKESVKKEEVATQPQKKVVKKKEEVAGEEKPKKKTEKKKEVPEEEEGEEEETEEEEEEEEETEIEEEEVEIIEEEEEYKVKIKPELSKKIKGKLEIRREIKKKTPNFRRQEWFRYKRLGTSWRKPRGLHSKARKHLGYRENVVSIGYGSPSEARNLHPSGFIEVMVYNVADLEKIDPKHQAARIGHSVGTRKRIDIEDEAAEKGIRVLNPRRV